MVSFRLAGAKAAIGSISSDTKGHAVGQDHLPPVDRFTRQEEIALIDKLENASNNEHDQ